MSEDSYQRRNPALQKALNRAMPEFKPKMAKGGMAKCYAKGGGIETKGKTKGRFV